MHNRSGDTTLKVLTLVAECDTLYLEKIVGGLVMALVDCPECGRENVSDTAEQCPQCGYAIKNYFEREKRKAYYAEQELVLKKNEKVEWDKLQEELNLELEKIDSLKPSPKPIYPNKFKHIFYYGGRLSLLSKTIIVGLFLFLLCYISTGIFGFLLVILIMFGIPFAAYITYLDYDIEMNCYKMKYNIWEEQQNDWEGYINKRKEGVREKYKNIAYNMARHGARNAPISNISSHINQMKCPMCSSTSVRKISTLNRTVSVATVGLASSKIGKQYECQKCKHKW